MCADDLTGRALHAALTGSEARRHYGRSNGYDAYRQQYLMANFPIINVSFYVFITFCLVPPMFSFCAYLNLFCAYLCLFCALRLTVRLVAKVLPSLILFLLGIGTLMSWVPMVLPRLCKSLGSHMASRVHLLVLILFHGVMRKKDMFWRRA